MCWKPWFVGKYDITADRSEADSICESRPDRSSCLEVTKGKVEILHELKCGALWRRETCAGMTWGDRKGRDKGWVGREGGREGGELWVRVGFGISQSPSPASRHQAAQSGLQNTAQIYPPCTINTTAKMSSFAIDGVVVQVARIHAGHANTTVQKVDLPSRRITILLIYSETGLKHWKILIAVSTDVTCSPEIIQSRQNLKITSDIATFDFYNLYRQL